MPNQHHPQESDTLNLGAQAHVPQSYVQPPDPSAPLKDFLPESEQGPRIAYAFAGA